MPGSRHLRLDVMVALVCAAGLTAQAADSPGESARTRRLSSTVTAAVAARVPRYAAPAPSGNGASAANDAGESSDGILHLKTMTVTTPRTLPLSGDESLTARGRLEKIMKQFPGLAVGPFARLNRAVGLAMYREDREAKARADLTDLVQRTSFDDNSTTRENLRLMKVAALRPNGDWASSRGTSH